LVSPKKNEKGEGMFQVTGESISLEQVLSGLKASNSGSVVTHVGVVRPASEGKKVASIEYLINGKEAERELGDIASEIRSRWEIEDIALCRRAGRLNFGEVILVAAVSAARHKAAFEACKGAVERMKIMKSVTKREVFVEGQASSIPPPPA
jgi:molybdopterin synthase catalytic subunit